MSSVGNAIIDYLQDGRTESNAEQIILSSMNQILEKPLKAPTVHSIVSKYFQLANIPSWKIKRHGAHTLRHSLATKLLKKNISMSIISTVLGYQKTDNTKIYFKIDINKLCLCSIPMPTLNSPYFKEIKR